MTLGPPPVRRFHGIARGLLLGAAAMLLGCAYQPHGSLFSGTPADALHDLVLGGCACHGRGGCACRRCGHGCHNTGPPADECVAYDGEPSCAAPLASERVDECCPEEPDACCDGSGCEGTVVPCGPFHPLAWFAFCCSGPAQVDAEEIYIRPRFLPVPTQPVFSPRDERGLPMPTAVW